MVSYCAASEMLKGTSELCEVYLFVILYLSGLLAAYVIIKLEREPEILEKLTNKLNRKISWTGKTLDNMDVWEIIVTSIILISPVLFVIPFLLGFCPRYC